MILDEWLADLPQQFKTKKNINILIAALSRQLDDLKKVYSDLNEQTTLDKAIGKNLDYVGTIIPLSRKQATAVLRKSMDTELRDDFYRKVLKYESLKNSCACTYQDIMDSIHILWETDRITYTEPEDRPATVLLNISDVNIDGPDPAENRVLSIKPSGVSLYYTYALWFSQIISGIGTVKVPHLNIKLAVKEVLDHEAKLIDGRYNLDGTIMLDGSTESIPRISNIYVKMKINSFTQSVGAKYRIDRDYRTLDGSYKLSSKLPLDAYYEEEVL